MQVGEARLPEERNLETIINKVEVWRDKTVSYQRVQSGITNLNWKISVAEDVAEYFLKIPGKNTELFIDRNAARDASKKAADAGVAPELVYYVEDDQVEIFEFLKDYQSCTVADMLDQKVRSNVIDTYVSVHKSPLFNATKTGFDQIDEHLRQVEEQSARTPRDLPKLRLEFERARQAIEATGFDIAPCYNDAYVTNYMIDGAKNVKIIDWEYAANNDPVWDLSLYCLECFFDKSTRKAILEQYFGEVREAAYSKLVLYYGLCLIKWALWACLQGKISTIAFDYNKYSSLLFLRARKWMADDDWERALQRV